MVEQLSVDVKITTIEDVLNFLIDKKFMELPSNWDVNSFKTMMFGESEVKLVTYEKIGQIAYSEEGYFKLFQLLSQILAIVRMRKGQQYQNSWCENGEHTVFDNVRRKFNRLENHYIDGNDSQDGESLFDTCADMGVYNFMFCTWFIVNKPEMFEKWLSNSTILNGKESCEFFAKWENIKRKYFNKGEEKWQKRQ